MKKKITSVYDLLLFHVFYSDTEHKGAFPYSAWRPLKPYSNPYPSPAGQIQQLLNLT